jgi:DNA repair protein RecN (Recombination protein N)
MDGRLLLQEKCVRLLALLDASLNLVCLPFHAIGCILESNTPAMAMAAMLRLLDINQFALIDQLRIEFHEGLNLLTGETGTGKSIIVDALGLLLGEKGYSEMIRTGSDRSKITGVFEFEENRFLAQIFEEHGLEWNAEELIIRRELNQNGKGRAFVNNQIIPVSFLRGIGPHLVDIHGQSEQQALYNSESQLEFLDANTSVADLLQEVVGFHRQRWQNLQRIQSLERSEQDRLRTLDLLSFQIQDIEKLQLKSDDEDLRLEEEHQLLANADKLYQLSNQAYTDLYEAETSASATLKHASRLLEELKRIDPRCDPLWQQLQSARIAADDVSRSLREYASKIKVDPQRLEWVENRMAEIARLKKKYGSTVSEVLAFCQKSRLELQALEAADETLETLKQEQVRLEQQYWKKAVELSQKRRAAATELEKKVERELAQLAMGKTRFRIALKQIESTRDAKVPEEIAVGTARGIDEVQFLLSANPGEDLRPLAKIASGGEISRIMLALKTVRSIDGRGKVLVFDEVDAGIGGQTADVVGQKLKKLSRRNQILCVTHLPQIASYADVHYRLEKRVEKGRTLTRMTQLDEDARVHEIARMISGERTTENVIKHAAELLKSAAK